MGLAESSGDAIASKCQRYVAGGSVVLACIILILVAFLWMCHKALKVIPLLPSPSLFLPPSKLPEPVQALAPLPASLSVSLRLALPGAC